MIQSVCDKNGQEISSGVKKSATIYFWNGIVIKKQKGGGMRATTLP